jgi:hypothetical protein
MAGSNINTQNVRLQAAVVIYNSPCLGHFEWNAVTWLVCQNEIVVRLPGMD